MNDMEMSYSATPPTRGVKVVLPATRLSSRRDILDDQASAATLKEKACIAMPLDDPRQSSVRPARDRFPVRKSALTAPTAQASQPRLRERHRGDRIARARHRLQAAPFQDRIKVRRPAPDPARPAARACRLRHARPLISHGPSQRPGSVLTLPDLQTRAGTRARPPTGLPRRPGPTRVVASRLAVMFPRRSCRSGRG